MASPKLGLIYLSQMILFYCGLRICRGFLGAISDVAKAAESESSARASVQCRRDVGDSSCSV